MEDSNLLMLLTTLSIAIAAPDVDQYFWSKVTSRDRWDHSISRTWDDQHWLELLHEESSILVLCGQLALTVQHHDTCLRATILVEKWVALIVWDLPTPDSYRSVADQFGVRKLIVGKVLIEISEAIRHMIYPKVVGIKNIPDFSWCLSLLFEMHVIRCDGNRHS